MGRVKVRRTLTHSRLLALYSLATANVMCVFVFCVRVSLVAVQ